MTSRKGILTIAALILLAFVCHAAMGSDANDNRTTTHAITVNAASLPDFDGDGDGWFLRLCDPCGRVRGAPG